MKKNLKRFVGAALTAAMLFSVSSISTFAEDDPAYSITINETGAQAAAHTYKAYQIFKGDVQGTGSNAVLANLNWADDFDGAGFLADAQTELSLTAAQVADASSVAKWLSENKEDADKVKAFADLARKHLGTTYSVTGTSGQAIGLDKAGYYLVVDETNVADKEDLSKSALILAVLGNETVNAKDDLPTVDKFVMDINDSIEADMDYSDETKWAKTADHDFNDTVPFKLVATLPSNFADYSKYNLVFTDELSAGLTYAANETSHNYEIVSAVIKGAGDNINIADKVTVTKSATADNTFTFTVADLKGLTDTQLTAINNAVEGGDVTVEIVYETKLNENANIGSTGNLNTVTLEYSNNPNYDVDKDGTSTGTDDDGDEDTTGTTTDIQAKVFTYKVVINKFGEKENSEPEALNGVTFKLSKKTADANFEEVETITMTDSNKFEFKGIDDGVYKLEEIAAPDGYNKISPMEFTVTAGHTDAGLSLDTLTGTPDDGSIAPFTVDTADENALTKDILDTQGIVLPSTGGMGTKVIYGAGGIMVAIAGVLLITKKRMGE